MDKIKPIKGRLCLGCKKSSLDNMFKCSACGYAYYCSKECQLKDWPNHKKQCKESLDTYKDEKKICELIKTTKGLKLIKLSENFGYIVMVNNRKNFIKILQVYQNESIVFSYLLDENVCELYTYDKDGLIDEYKRLARFIKMDSVIEPFIKLVNDPKLETSGLSPIVFYFSVCRSQRQTKISRSARYREQY